MEAHLIINTFHAAAIEKMYLACKTCYSEHDAGILWKACTNIEPTKGQLEKQEELVLKVLRAGHLSIAEHISITFTIDGISRALSHQLVRHRHATYSQKSQRYVTCRKPFKYVTPDTIRISKFRDRYIKLMKEINEFYKDMVDEGIPTEDARYIFPNACKTSLVFSCNLREFIHICNLRLCQRSQWEIRELINQMKGLLTVVYPFMAEFFIPKCKTCTEYDSCNMRVN